MDHGPDKKFKKKKKKKKKNFTWFEIGKIDSVCKGMVWKGVHSENGTPVPFSKVKKSHHKSSIPKVKLIDFRT